MSAVCCVPGLKQAGSGATGGEISGDELRAMEDSSIRRSSLSSRNRVPERHGWRIPARHVALRFSRAVDGVETSAPTTASRSRAASRPDPRAARYGKVGFSSHPMSVISASSKRYGATAKMTIPSPSVLHFRGGRHAVSVRCTRTCRILPGLGPRLSERGRRVWRRGLPLPSTRRSESRLSVRRGTTQLLGRAATIRTAARDLRRQ